MEILTVNSKIKNYNILLGDNILGELNKNMSTTSRKVIITDENIYHLGLTDKLKIDNLCDIIVIPPSEKSKNIEVVCKIITKLTEINLNRNDYLIAFGGGVVGDITGFVASIYMRGINFIQIPTTLLSMVDSSVGGKTGINFSNYKNNVGSFYNPELVIIDTTLLETLNKRQFNCGLAEIIKMGLIKNEEIIKILEVYDIEKRLKELIKLSIIGKIEVIEIDEKESGLRKILNFGHTIGHGIESYYNFDGILHGEAVAIGMIKMIEDEKIKIRLKYILNKFDFNFNINYDENKVLNLIVHDKKVVSDDEIDIILLKEIGQAYIKRVSFFSLRKYL